MPCFCLYWILPQHAWCTSVEVFFCCFCCCVHSPFFLYPHRFYSLVRYTLLLCVFCNSGFCQRTHTHLLRRIQINKSLKTRFCTSGYRIFIAGCIGWCGIRHVYIFVAEAGSHQPAASNNIPTIYLYQWYRQFFFLFFSPTLRTNFLHGSRIVVMYAFRCCCYSSCISFLTRSSSQIFIVDTHTFHTISLSFFIFLRCWDISWLTCSFKPKTNDEHYCYSCHFSCATKINWKRHDERYVCRNTPHHTHIRYIMSVEWV